MGISESNESCGNDSRIEDLRVKDTQIEDSRLGVIAALVVTGFGIGWLAGLSVSPVVSIVITSVTGSVATIIAALSGVKEEFLTSEAQPNMLKQLLEAVTPVPLAWLVVGLMMGASAGVFTRSHDLLSPSPSVTPSMPLLEEDVQRWIDLGLNKEEVVRGYFESRIKAGPLVVDASAGQAPTHKDSVLFATASQTECDTWQRLIDKADYEQLVTEVRSSAIIPFRQLPGIVTDTVRLSAIVGEVLCVKTPP